MLSLYKDPDGEGVFSAHDDPGQVTTVHVVGGPPAQQSELQKENDNLRKRVKELEDVISEYQVNVYLGIVLVYTLIGVYILQKDLAANDGPTASLCNGGCSSAHVGGTVPTAMTKKAKPCHQDQL